MTIKELIHKLYQKAYGPTTEVTIIIPDIGEYEVKGVYKVPYVEGRIRIEAERERGRLCIQGERCTECGEWHYI